MWPRNFRTSLNFGRTFVLTSKKQVKFDAKVNSSHAAGELISLCGDPLCKFSQD